MDQTPDQMKTQSDNEETQCCGGHCHEQPEGQDLLDQAAEIQEFPEGSNEMPGIGDLIGAIQSLYSEIQGITQYLVEMNIRLNVIERLFTDKQFHSKLKLLTSDVELNDRREVLRDIAENYIVPEFHRAQQAQREQYQRQMTEMAQQIEGKPEIDSSRPQLRIVKDDESEE